MMKKRFADTDAKAVESVVPHHNGHFQSYMTNKIAKLSEQNNLNGDLKSTIFRGCFVFVNGATNPPSSEIRRLVAMNGGTFCGYLTGSVTHVVCDHFTDAQLKQQYKKRKETSDVYYVNAEWVLQSIARGKRQSESLFLPMNHWSRSSKQQSIVSMLTVPVHSNRSTITSTSTFQSSVQIPKKDKSSIVIIDMVSPTQPPADDQKLSMTHMPAEGIETPHIQETEPPRLDPELATHIQEIINHIHGSRSSGRSMNILIKQMIDNLLISKEQCAMKWNAVKKYGFWLIQEQSFEQVRLHRTIFLTFNSYLLLFMNG